MAATEGQHGLNRVVADEPAIPESWHTDWHEPDRFFSEVEAMLEPYDSEVIFSDPKFQTHFDAFIAGKLAVIRNTHEPTRVRLVKGEAPDFELNIQGEVEPFEATEADRADRRRGDEYREVAKRRKQGLPKELEMFSPSEEMEHAREAIPRVIENKAKKRYRPPPHLVVMVNLTTFGDIIPVPELADLTSPFQGFFASIWIVWGHRAIRTWPDLLDLIGPPAPESAPGY